MLFSEELLRGKKILITGGTGFLGKNLCEFLIHLNTNYNLKLTIYVMARRNENLFGVEFIQHDLTEEYKGNSTFDYIIHAATPVVYDQSTNDEILKIIVNGTQHICEFAKKTSCKKILIVSSGAVYGLQPDDVEFIDENYFNEVSIYDSKNAYGTGKRLSEIVAKNILKDSGVEFSVARGFAFSGKYLAFDQHFALGNFVRDAIETHVIKVKGDGQAIRSYMDSEDLSYWLIVLLLLGKNNEAYNLGSEEMISIKDLAQKVAGFVSGSRVEIQNLKIDNVKKNRYVPSTKKAQKEFGLKLTVSLDQSIKKMIRFYKELK